jgi:hypothetical protein
MTDQTKIAEPNDNPQSAAQPGAPNDGSSSLGLEQPGSPQDRCAAAGLLMRLPGLIAISLYMVILAGTIILGVASHHFAPLYLVFPAFFIAAALGLLMLFRWAWALTLAAILLMTATFFYQFAVEHALALLVQGLLNLVFFLYLVRTEVRASLR